MNRRRREHNSSMSGVKLDKLKDDYNDPRDDTCIRAFVIRILSEIARTNALSQHSWSVQSEEVCM